MKIGDIIWTAMLACIVGALLYPPTHAAILDGALEHPFLVGFVKFAILASMGELLAIRITGGCWSVPCGMAYRSVVWGVVGLFMVEMFAVFAAGVHSTIENGLLPGNGSALPRFVTALWSSILLNAVSGPVVMTGHRVADTYLDLSGGRILQLRSVSLKQVVAAIDWQGLVGFIWLKTLPFFWIPAHTITFLLPPQYRILFAAFLSLALGVVLAFAKRSKTDLACNGWVMRENKFASMQSTES